MMRLKNFTNNLKGIAYRFLLLLMGAQIILGALWFFGNLTAVQALPEAEELLEISRTWVLDDYVGIAYPALLWLFQKLFGGFYTVPLYALQLATVFGAACFLLEKAGIVKKDQNGRVNFRLLWGGAYIATLPMIMQFVAAGLPYAFGLGSCMIVLGECFVLCREKSLSGKKLRKELGVLFVSFFAGNLFMTDYIWVLGVPVFVSFVIFAWRSRKWQLPFLASFVALLCICTLVTGLYQVPGSRGRMEKSVSATLLRRCVWPNFEQDYFFWSHNVKILFPAQDMISVSCEPEEVLYNFGYRMEETYGKEVADEEYMLMVRSECAIRTKELLKDIALDVAGYICPPVAARLHLQGLGVSYSGWSYHFMGENTPSLTRIYWNVGQVIFFVSVVLGGLLFLLRAKGTGKKVWGASVLFSVITVLWNAVWYGMSAAGMWDYKNGLPVVALWAVGIVFAWCCSWDEEMENA